MAPPSGSARGPCCVHASPEFLSRHIPRILAGEELWVQFFSEPEAGSDLAGIRTAGRCATGIAGSSTGRRSGAAAPTTRTTACAWPAPTGTSPSTEASPGSRFRPPLRGHRPADHRDQRRRRVLPGVLRRRGAVSDDDVIGDVDQGWRVAQTMLVFERGGGAGAPPPAPTGQRLAPIWWTWPSGSAAHQDPTVRQMIATAHTNDYAHDPARDPYRRQAGGRRDGRRGRRLRQARHGHATSRSEHGSGYR